MIAANRHARCLGAVSRWYDLVSVLESRNLVELRRTFPSADKVGNTLVFNIAGNNYRLLCCVDWAAQRLFFRSLLTHAEYDCTNVEAICP
ncbi:MAG: type II toxin-antitoxin system HigB family toxin [Acidobacteria bacterium]|nr:type II toxin-antitoxin system HigB family toxin [Acidobacteriota bacterium]